MKKIVLVATLLVFSAVFAYADSGFYLKGELGYSNALDASLMNDKSTADPNDDQLAPGSKLQDIGHGATFGLGVGYQFNQFFRADITGYVRDGFDIDDTSFNGTQKFSGDIDSKAIMLNLYAQKEFNRIIPFIGFGIGHARNKVDSLSYTAGGLKGKGPGKTKSGFAWQISAGAGYKITEKFIVDLEYRYADLGKIAAGKGANNLNEFGLGTVSLNGVKGDLKVQEAVLSLRYLF